MNDMTYRPWKSRKILLCGLCLWVVCFTNLSSQQTVDQNATDETLALYENLKSLSSKAILFGHQDALAYGVMWKDWHKSRSDVADVCGKYPAVFGWDLGALGMRPYNIDSVHFDHMQDWMKRAYKMGSINTVSWHMNNFYSGGGSWDTTGRVVSRLLPGGSHHAAYLKSLDDLAAFANALEVGFLRKRKVPLIFRPFHEHTGSWFWWGQPHCTPEEYKELWQFTVKYLRDTKGVHNLLYAYSTDIFRDREHYLECYPGDEWVDVLGMDNYHDVGSNGNSSELVRRLGIVATLAEERGKVAALTETGREAIPEEKWWTETLLNPIKSDPQARKIVWVLVWRNAKTTHHYAPYPGHLSAPNFVEFSNDPVMRFQDGLPLLYRRQKTRP